MCRNLCTMLPSYLHSMHMIASQPCGLMEKQTAWSLITSIHPASSPPTEGVLCLCIRPTCHGVLLRAPLSNEKILLDSLGAFSCLRDRFLCKPAARRQTASRGYQGCASSAAPHRTAQHTALSKAARRTAQSVHCTRHG
jgi:hypothetical protein